MAANAGCMALVRWPMGRAQHGAELRGELLRELRSKEQLPSLGRSMHQSIGEAVLGNHVDVVEYLLGEKSIEAHLQYRNSLGETIFIWHPGSATQRFSTFLPPDSRKVYTR